MRRRRGDRLGFSETVEGVDCCRVPSLKPILAAILTCRAIASLTAGELAA
jgi:hypothetical protein